MTSARKKSIESALATLWPLVDDDETTTNASAVDGFAKTLKSVASAAVLKQFSLDVGVSGGSCAIERPIIGREEGAEGELESSLRGGGVRSENSGRRREEKKKLWKRERATANKYFFFLFDYESQLPTRVK